jgi:predicted aspartyl protease
VKLCSIPSVLLLALSVAATAQEPQGVVIGSMSEHFEVPFRLFRGYLMVVQGSLGTGNAMNFLVDTGADPSVIDSKVAQRLKLNEVNGKLALLNQNIEVKRAVLPSLKIGPLRAESLPILVRDLAFLQSGLGVSVDGVIGLDVLGRSNFALDYKRKRLIFGSVQPLNSRLSFQSGPPFITVQIEADGQQMNLLLDTGASGLLLFRSRIRDRFPYLTASGEKASSNMGGDVRLQQVMFAKIRLGETDFGRQKAFLVEDQRDSGREFDGLLGISTLGLTQIAFDFERHILFWKK